MNLFKFRMGKKKEINWMTVKCGTCKSSGENQTGAKPYLMFVDRDEIKVKTGGQKGRIQLYTTCTKCGKSVIIPEKDVPKNILDYIMQKVGDSDNKFKL